MPKPLLWFFIFIGAIFFLFSLLGFFMIGHFSGGSFFMSLLMIGIALFFGIGPEGTLRQEQVIDSWAYLIEKAHNRAEEIFSHADSGIKESKAPALETKRKNMSPSIIGGLMGSERDFMIITNRDSLRMAPYRMFLNARDYGENLDVSWYLTFKPTTFQALLSLIPFVNIVPRSVSDIDLFDQQDLRAYTTVAHHSVLNSVEQLMLSLSQDPKTMERKSRGFLGIS